MDMIMDMDGIRSGSRRSSGRSGITGVGDDRDGRRGTLKINTNIDKVRVVSSIK